MDSFDFDDIFEKYDPYIYLEWFDRQNLSDMLRRAADWIPMHRELLSAFYGDWINEQKEWRPYYEFVLERFIIWSYANIQYLGSGVFLMPMHVGVFFTVLAQLIAHSMSD